MNDDQVNLDIECPHCQVHFNVAPNEEIPEACPACGNPVSLSRPDVAARCAVTCADCGFKGNPKKRGGFNIIIFAVLLLLGILPAIVYALFCPGEYYCCPECKSRRLSWPPGSEPPASKGNSGPGCCGCLLLIVLAVFLFKILHK
jgi:DNA-directed RNA polymerase subunit RPC12/RpoP